MTGVQTCALPISARFLGADDTAQSIERKGEELKKKAASVYEPTTEQEVKEAYEKDYLSGLGKSFTKNISEPVGDVAGGFGPLIAASTVGGVPLGAAAVGEGLAGAGAAKEKGAKDINALGAGVGISAVNTLGGALLPPSLRAKAEEALIAQLAKGTAGAAAVGTGISIADENTARAFADQPLMTTEEMKQTALEAAKIAPVFGAAQIGRAHV